MLETMIRYMAEDGLTTRGVKPEDLFGPELLST